MSALVKELVTEYIEAVGEGRLDRVEELLHPDVVFDGTVAAGLRGAPAYLTALRRLGTILRRNQVRQVLVEGDQAFVLYDFVTDTEAGTVLSAESLTIEDGRIRTVTLLFDWRRWPEVMAELSRRMAQPAPAANA